MFGSVLKQKSMNFFSRSEVISIIVIFLILIAVSWPNFALSLRRARDQVRRDDIGQIQSAIDEYYADYGVFPMSTSDGRMIVCKGPGENLIACNWGHDTWINLTPGVNKVYMNVLPGDPNLSYGTTYDYFSDGSRYQLFGALEGIDEPGYDAKLAVRGVKCGNKICSIGRANNVPLYMSIEEYDLQIYCAAHPGSAKCLNKQIDK
jgi:type II secretory pathway pseudopilin PulG